MVKFSSKILLAGFCAIQPAASIEIDLRYDYDTSGFFDQPGAREAMRVCADFFENILTDSLTEINAAASGSDQNSWAARPQNPATGATLNLENLVVPADTMIIYLGARDLGGDSTGVATTGYSAGGYAPFVDAVKARGQLGALQSSATDYGPWGGSISFDTRLSNGNSRQWNFSISESTPGKTDFVGVALHELCHLLGIGFADSFKDLVPSGETFTGAASRVANGGVRPLVQPDKGHWKTNSPGPYVLPAYGSFGTPHGLPQRVLMDPLSIGGLPDIPVVTDLEIAALIDIGWEVALPAQGLTTEEFFNGSRMITIPTTSNYIYRIQRGDLVTPFENLSGLIEGDGTLQSYVDNEPLALKGFYRFTMSKGSLARSRSVQAVEPVDGKSKFRTASDSRESVGCCVGH